MYYGHHAKPVCLAWAPDNEHFATGGMDMMVYVWDVKDPEKRLKIPGSSRHSFVVVNQWWMDGGSTQLPTVKTGFNKTPELDSFLTLR